MNILMLSEVSSELVIGGAERVLREQLVGLSNLGHGVQAVVRAPDEEHSLRLVVNGIVERRYEPRRGNAVVFVLSSIVRSIRAFDGGRTEGEPDAVLIHQALAGLGPIFMRKNISSHWIYVCHSLAHEEYVTRHRPAMGIVSKGLFALHSRFRFWIEQLVIRRCQAVVVLSEFMKVQVMASHQIPEERIHIIPGGADHHHFCPSADRKAVRSRLGISRDAIVLFTVRNLVPRMGLEALINAIAELRTTIPGFQVIIGGKGPLEGPLRQLVQDLDLSEIVRFKGYIPDEDLPRYFQAADLVLMPTQELEGFGLVTVEALACGTPVLGTPIGAIPEVLSLVDSSLIAQASTSGALAEAMSYLIRQIREQPDRWSALSHRARSVVEQHFTWVHHNTHLEAVIREAVPIGG